MTRLSPFSLQRFEYDRPHLYYLEEKLFGRLLQSKPCFLIGTRGTGKTTLLMALNWREQFENPSLRKALDAINCSRSVVGVYLKLPEFCFESFDAWLGTCDDNLYGEIVSLYFDLLWTPLVFQCVAERSVEGQTELAPEHERAFVAALVDKLGCASLRHLVTEHTLLALKRGLDQLRRGLELSALSAKNPVQALEELAIRGMGAFGREVACSLVNLMPAGADGHDWMLKVCFDEGEVLSARQQLVLNTMIRLSASPVYFVVSYVGGPRDATSTMKPGLTLQAADRDYIQLDEERRRHGIDRQFRNLVEGVCSVRVREMLGRDDVSLSLRKILGSEAVNEQLQRVLEQSASERAASLLAAAKQLEITPFAESCLRSKLDRAGGVLPVYQAFLFDAFRQEVPEPNKPSWMSRHQVVAEMRKKMVATSLVIYRALRSDVRYSSMAVVLQLSDSCIRDFLSFMDALFRASEIEVEAFLLQRLSPDAQDQALKEASRRKRAAIGEAAWAYPSKTKHLVTGLAQLTAWLQNGTGDTQRALRSSERGWFACEDMSSEIESLVRDAAEAGYLRVRVDKERISAFRVHASLAPAFGFSYRGAYYVSQLALSELSSLTDAESPCDLERAVQAIGNRIDGVSDNQLGLWQ